LSGGALTQEKIMSTFREVLRGLLHRRLGLAVLVLLPATAVAQAQATCDDALREAQKSYELGLFEDVPGQLAPCLGARISRATGVQVHSLLARTYLAADDVKRARLEAATILRLDSGFEPGSPPRFVELIAQLRQEEQTVQVASVSKTKESLREAPATVIVVTAEEIERRGYLDLEQVLHDLPGFDISRLNGDIYSFIYQRGYRSRYNDRDLLLLDGVEQNDLASNNLYLSRQYPLSNIDRIEVLYGPASTMYGANAYTGVINIITKQPEDLVAANRRIGFTAQAGGGSLEARFADLVLAGKDQSGNLAWSLAGHFHDSNEPDLSRFSDWNYNYDAIDYRDQLRLTGPLAAFFISQYPCGAGASPYYRCGTDSQGGPTVELTDQGASFVRAQDRRLLESRDLSFSDHTQDWSLFGKLRISNLTVGFELWRAEEGASAWITKLFFGGRAVWTPQQALVYLRFSQPIGNDLTFNLFTRFQQSGFDRSASRYTILHNYANGFLSLFSLVPPCISAVDPQPVGCPANPWLEDVTYGGSSNQIRNELSLVYEPSEKVNVVGGLELAKSSIESDYDQLFDGPFGPSENSPVQSEHTDLALYAQGAYKPSRQLKLVLAGRLHHNEIDNRLGASGFGTLFMPRAAIIYMPGGGPWVLKGIYSEAFKDPTDFEKFGTVKYAREVRSGHLRPERVKNIEVSAGWQPAGAWSVEVAAYQADYSDIISLRSVPYPECTLDVGCFQLHNHDAYRIRGLQATARYRLRRAEIWGNYTFTEPFQTNPEDADGNPLFDAQGNRIRSLRIADIASHHFNLGLGVDWPGKVHSDLRLQYVGSRKTGEMTTAPANPFDHVGGYAAVDATISYKGLLPGTTLQLIANNLFDKRYFDPGTQVDTVGAPRVPQAGRTLYLRLIRAAR
jgi:outer membrane receptor protein involved in Fe transport